VGSVGPRPGDCPRPARKIEAIKVYCEETGAGLADSKDVVEAWIDSQKG
jgi:ribosomal protein L7/L12